MRLSCSAGLRTVLAGLDGDKLFGGYPSFEDIPRMVRMLALGLVILCFQEWFRLVSALILKHLTSPKCAGLLEYGCDYSGACMPRLGLYMSWELPYILDTDLV